MTKEILKALRTYLGLTQQQFAESIGTNKYKISHWEAGRNQISPAYQSLIEAKYPEELDSIRVK
jgi:DNA-binding transcriptional regulator YiaG